jgi:hypothetical protein
MPNLIRKDKTSFKKDITLQKYENFRRNTRVEHTLKDVKRECLHQACPCEDEVP